MRAFVIQSTWGCRALWIYLGFNFGWLQTCSNERYLVFINNFWSQLFACGVERIKQKESDTREIATKALMVWMSFFSSGVMSYE